MVKWFSLGYVASEWLNQHHIFCVFMQFPFLPQYGVFNSDMILSGQTNPEEDKAGSE